MNPMNAFCRMAAIFAGMTFIVSCGGKIDARVECEGKVLAIIPFSVEAEGQSMGCFESKTGETLASLASAMIKANEPEVRILGPQVLRSAFAGGKTNLRRLQELCKKHHVDMVVMTTLTRWRLNDPRNPGMRLGQAALEVVVTDAQGLSLYEAQLTDLVFPRSLSRDPAFAVPGQSTLTLSEDQVRKGLEQVTAQRLAELFYDHEAEEP